MKKRFGCLVLTISTLASPTFATVAPAPMGPMPRSCSEQNLTRRLVEQQNVNRNALELAGAFSGLGLVGGLMLGGGAVLTGGLIVIPIVVVGAMAEVHHLIFKVQLSHLEPSMRVLMEARTSQGGEALAEAVTKIQRRALDLASSSGQKISQKSSQKSSQTSGVLTTQEAIGMIRKADEAHAVCDSNGRVMSYDNMLEQVLVQR